MESKLFQSWIDLATRQPEAVAVIEGARRTVASRRLVLGLGTHWATEFGGGLAGRTVTFAEPNGAEWLRVFLGLLASGAVVAPLDPGEPRSAQRALAAAAGAAFHWEDGRLETIGPGRRRPGRIRLLKLTSGSTGGPRALAFTEEQLWADGRNVATTMKIRAADRNLGCIPFGHSYGLGNLVVPLLARGTAIVTDVPPLPHALAAAIAEWKVTVFPAVPALLRALAEAKVDAAQLRSLRTVISAGAPLAPETAAAFQGWFGQPVHNFYGSSETGGIAYDRSGQCALTGRSVGRPLRGVKLEFGAGRRFWVCSAAVQGRGRFRPADLGERNTRGELVLLGRSGRMLKLAGRRIDPAEVERALRNLPGVADAFVDLHPARPDALAAVVATTRATGEWVDVLRQTLAPWKIPKKWVTLPAFPLTARGKTDMRKLRALL